MATFMTVLHVFTSVLLILVVLIQSGKGAEISASFAGSSQTVFGSSGGANFFTKFTAVAATIFMVTSIGLTLMGSKNKKSLFEGTTSAPISRTAPAVPQSAPAAPGLPPGSNAAAPAAPNTKK